MATLTQPRLRRAAVLGVALLAIVTMMAVITGKADAAKPDQIVGARYVTMMPGTCDLTIEANLNTKGPMNNDIVFTVFGSGGFTVTRQADRGATIRATAAVAGPGVYSGQVASVDRRTGAEEQVMALGLVSCS